MFLGVQGHTQPWVSFHLASSVTGSLSYLALPIRLGWPAPGLRNPPVPTSPALGLQLTPPHPALLQRHWRANSDPRAR